MSEPFDDWQCKFDASPEQRMELDDLGGSISCASDSAGKRESDFTFPCGAVCEHDDEVTETKIRAFLDEKVRRLRKNILMDSLNGVFRYFSDNFFL